MAFSNPLVHTSFTHESSSAHSDNDAFPHFAHFGNLASGPPASVEIPGSVPSITEGAFRDCMHAGKKRKLSNHCDNDATGDLKLESNPATASGGITITKGVTLLSPHGQLIAKGWKDIENRPWQPRSMRVGEWFAIHVGKGFDKNAATCDVMERARIAYPDPMWDSREAAMQYGKPGELCCIAQYGGATPLDENADNPWATGPICWRLLNVIPIQATLREELGQMRGHLSVWQLPDSVIDELSNDHKLRGMILNADMDTER